MSAIEEPGPKHLRIMPTTKIMQPTIVQCRNAPGERWQTLWSHCDKGFAQDLMRERAIRWGATIEEAKP